MPKKLTFEFVKSVFEKEGYKLLSTEYINADSKLKYLCPNNHENEIRYSHFKSGNRCPDCKKLTIEFIRSVFEKENYELLSKEYINSKTKLKYKCQQGHFGQIAYTSFQQGHRCAKCANNKKYNYSEVKNYFSQNNYILISKDYINSHSLLEYECPLGHLGKICYYSFIQNHRCPICANNKKLSYNEVKNEFEKFSYKLISKEYINNHSLLEYECDNYHKNKISFKHFRRGERCPDCKHKTEKLVFEFLKENFEQVISQAKFDWCKDKRCLPFDFIINDIIIEVDGQQHFDQVSTWKDPKETQERDFFKMNKALENNYKIIRISQEDIFRNKINWKELLLEAIEKLKTTEQNILYIAEHNDIDENDLYVNYQLEFCHEY